LGDAWLCEEMCEIMCEQEVQWMPTNLALNDELIDEARRLGGHSTKKEAVNQALAEYVARRKRRRVKEIFGKVGWDPEYDYKAERKRR